MCAPNAPSISVGEIETSAETHRVGATLCDGLLGAGGALGGLRGGKTRDTSQHDGDWGCEGVCVGWTSSSGLRCREVRSREDEKKKKKLLRTHARLIRPFAAVWCRLALLASPMAASFGSPNTLSDEQLAFLLQQEEYSELHNALVSASKFPASSGILIAPKHDHGASAKNAIVLDDSMSEEEQKVVVKPKPVRQQEDEIGILDVHELFVRYNELYFNGLLASVTVEWSAKMTLCAGLCSWRKNGDCRIKLSSKLLQFRSNKELKETLLVRD